MLTCNIQSDCSDVKHCRGRNEDSARSTTYLDKHAFTLHTPCHHIDTEKGVCLFSFCSLCLSDWILSHRKRVVLYCTRQGTKGKRNAASNICQMIALDLRIIFKAKIKLPWDMCPGHSKHCGPNCVLAALVCLIFLFFF